MNDECLRALEKALALLHSVQVLDGSDKDQVESLLEFAVIKLKTGDSRPTIP